jgi:hypothetical protein
MHGRAACSVGHLKHGGGLLVRGQIPIIAPEAHRIGRAMRLHYKAHIVSIFVIRID